MLTDTQIILALDRIVGDTKSQDKLDIAAEELDIAKTIARYAEKRVDRAKDTITAFFPDKIAETKAAATKTKLKHEHTARGAEYIIAISCNAPAMRVDAAAFRNELIKAGLDRAKIDIAYAAAHKASAPATSFNAIRIEE